VKEGKRPQPMKVIPSVDIQDGKCVKLVQGKPGTGREISDDPLKVAEAWEAEGAEILHVVDLDAAFTGSRKNRETVKKIIRSLRIPVEVGGGIRRVEDARELVEAGARWVILGTVAVERPQAISVFLNRVGGDRVIVALDSRGGRVVTRGWTAEAAGSPFNLIRFFTRQEVAAFLYTDVNVEGTLSGLDTGLVRKVVDSTDKPVIYAGGVSSLQDLLHLAKAGVWGAVVGRALYEGVFTLKEAKEIVRNAAG